MFDRATVIPVQSADLDLYWPSVASFIESALKHTDLEVGLNDIRDGIAAQDRQLFVIKDKGEYIAAVVTMIYTTLSGIKIADITFAGGSRYDRWDHFVDAVTPWFLEQDCRFIDIPGRRGWVAKFKDKGFRERYVVMRKEIGNVEGIKEDNL